MNLEESIRFPGISFDFESENVLVRLEGNESHKEILLMPEGTRLVDKATDVDVTMSEEILAGIANVSNKRNRDTDVDFTHNTFKNVPVSEKRAAGWIKAGSFSFKKALGLTALVEFTKEAGALISEKKFRFFSVVIETPVNEKSSIFNVALTNTPRVDFSIDPILAESLGIVNNESEKGGKRPMSTAAIAQRLGLQSEASEEAILEALDTRPDGGVLLLDSITNAAGLEGEVNSDTIVELLKNGKDSQSQVIKLETEKMQMKITGAIDKAQREGKITKSDRKKWADRLQSDDQMFLVLEELPVQFDLEEVGTSADVSVDGDSRIILAEKKAIQSFDTKLGVTPQYERMDLHLEACKLQSKDENLEYGEACLKAERILELGEEREVTD